MSVYMHIKFSSYISVLKGPRSSDAPIAVRAPQCLILGSKYHSAMKGTRTLTEKAEFRTGSGNVLDELDLCLVPESKIFIWSWGHVRRIQKPAGKGFHCPMSNCQGQFEHQNKE